MWHLIPMSPEGGTVCIDGLYGLLTRNTRPDELEWRATWFSDHAPIDHIALSYEQVQELLRLGYLRVNLHYITLEMVK